MRKKRIIPAILFSMFLLSFNAAAGTPSAKYITGPELEQMMQDGKKLAIIDVRESAYFGRGHIPGAIHVSSDTAYNKRDIVSEYQPKDRVVIVGYGGTAGQEIIDMFLARGYENVYGLKGGMREWKGPIAK